MWFVSAQAAEIEVPMAVSAPLGEPARGMASALVEVAERVGEVSPVVTDAGGFTLTCTGRGRRVTLAVGYNVAAFPENIPVELVCTVGADTFTVRLENDLELGYKRDDHPTLRGAGYSSFAIPAGSEGRGRLVDAADLRVRGVECRVEGEQLIVERSGPIAPGGYRCLVRGRDPIPVEVLPD